MCPGAHGECASQLVRQRGGALQVPQPAGGRHSPDSAVKGWPGGPRELPRALQAAGALKDKLPTERTGESADPEEEYGEGRKIGLQETTGAIKAWLAGFCHHGSGYTTSVICYQTSNISADESVAFQGLVHDTTCELLPELLCERPTTLVCNCESQASECLHEPKRDCKVK